MAVIDSAHDFRIGRVVSQLFETLFANLGAFVLLALALMAPLLLVEILTVVAPDVAGRNAAGNVIAGKSLQHLATSLFRIAATFLGGLLTQLAVTHMTVEYLAGKRAGVGPAFSEGVLTLPAMIWIGILQGLGIGLGCLLLLVPGLILMCTWSVVLPVRLMEQTGVVETFDRSRELTRGHRGRIFLLFLIYLLVLVAVTFSLRPLMGISLFLPKASEITVTSTVVEWFEQVMYYIVQAILFATVYHELRAQEGGVGFHELAEAFD